LKTTFIANSEAELPRITQDLLTLIGKPSVVLFYGKMGVGKTTLIRSLCSALGVDEAITSPTFSLVNEYLSSTGETIYHFDFYRIETKKKRWI